MKHVHLLFVLLVITSFVWRVYLAEKNPAMLAQKWLKILPHALAGALLLSGGLLVLQGNWADNYGWIVIKLILLVAFIGFGLLTFRRQGMQRWIAFSVSIYCFIYIISVAFTKQVSFF